MTEQKFLVSGSANDQNIVFVVIWNRKYHRYSDIQVLYGSSILDPLVNVH